MDAIFGGDSIRIRPDYGTVYQEKFTYHLTYSGEFYSQITSFRGLISPLHLLFGTPLHLRYDENQQYRINSEFGEATWYYDYIRLYCTVALYVYKSA